MKTSDPDERLEYERKVARYLAPVLTDNVGAYIQHKQLNRSPGSESWNLQVSLGPIYDKQVDCDSGDCHRPPMQFDFFTVELHDWPLWRSLELDLGPRFKKALQLLLEACEEARDEYLRER